MAESIAAARRRQRIRIVVALLLGGAAALLAHREEALGGSAGLLGPLPVLLFAGAILWVVWRRPGRGELRVDEQERAFYVPPRPGVGLAPVWAGYAAYQAVGSAFDAPRDRTSLAFAVLFGIFALGIAVGCWRRAPGVELTPDGITHRHLEREVFVPWAAVDPAGRVGTPSPRRVGAISLPIVRPELLRGRGWGRTRDQVGTAELDLAPARLAAVLRHYVTHPEDRSAIGTTGELARLRQRLDGPA
ncbi:hypothetical protein [Micromonospora siamensis]|uniref:PH domain-containing protein n=1 Tax=Micromonospora siamensis TaxID=299152 RepID=A0A1C5H9P7_9ACTN|nr:hypothetical protein [Micromonospora siamensis]SCG42749.1 hypothetical protein GA0074704_1315 [Micromonospora siamensis]